MKKKLLFFLPFLFLSIFLFTNSKNAQAVIVNPNYQYVEAPNYPYRATQTTSYQNRFLWQNNHIYTNVDYTTWIKDGKAGTTWYQDPHWDGGEYVNYTIARKFFGIDHFVLKNLNTGGELYRWDSPRLDIVYGEKFARSTCLPSLYRRETGWIDIGGAKPNTPSGYTYRSGTNYYFNVSGTSSNLANLKADFSFTSSAGNSYVDTGSGISSQAEDYVVGFQYIIDQNPATDVNLYNSTYSPNGNIDVTGPFQSDRTWYIHIATRSYTNILSDRLDRPLQDASLKTTLTLTGDEGIASVVGAGQYYPGQTVKINATLKPEGVKWKGWVGDSTPFTQEYSFTMPATNTTYHATTQLCSYILDFDGNGSTNGTMESIPVTYKTVLNLPKNLYQRTTVPCTFVGWDLNKDKMAATYKDTQSIAIADLIKALNVTNTDARLPLFAIWDEAPGFIITQSPDRYFTLDEAKSGIITEQVLLSTVEATDKETNPLAKKTIADVLASGNDIGITTYNYQTSDFTELHDQAIISMLYQVKDVAGNHALLAINVYIVNNEPVSQTRDYRSIEGKYLYKEYETNLSLPLTERKGAEQLELLEPEKGGLKLSSYWRTNRRALDKIYNQEIKELPPERIIRIKEETLAKIKKDLLENKVDYTEINRGSDFKFSNPVGENYELLEYIRK